jgi:hypothetical protein
MVPPRGARTIERRPLGPGADGLRFVPDVHEPVTFDVLDQQLVVLPIGLEREDTPGGSHPPCEPEGEITDIGPQVDHGLAGGEAGIADLRLDRFVFPPRPDLHGVQRVEVHPEPIDLDDRPGQRELADHAAVDLGEGRPLVEPCEPAE